MNNPHTIYCDMDGVLVDFLRGCKQVLGKAWDDPYYNTKEKRDARKKIISEHTNFWATLPPERDFDQIWGFCKNFEPNILTAYPDWDEKNARHGKWIWNEKHTHVPRERFHCVEREAKRYFAKDHHPGLYHGKPNVLVDDFPDNIREWNASGGIGILHTSAINSITQLKKLGFSV